VKDELELRQAYTAITLHAILSNPSFKIQDTIGFVSDVIKIVDQVIKALKVPPNGPA
jgi:hypothetical protein